MRKLVPVAAIIFLLVVAGGAQAAAVPRSDNHHTNGHFYSGAVWIESSYAQTGDLGMVVSANGNGFVTVELISPQGVTVNLRLFSIVFARGSYIISGVGAWLYVNGQYQYTIVPVEKHPSGGYYLNYIPLTSSAVFPISGGGSLFIPQQDPSWVVPASPIIGHIIN